MTTTRRGGRGPMAMAAAVVATAGLLSTGCTGGGGASPPLLGIAARLVSFDSCDGLLEWFHDQAASRVTAYGLDTGSPFGGRMVEDASSARNSASSSASPSNSDQSASVGAAAATGGGSGPGFSMTNVQEAGVGEPDLAVTDGTRLVSVVGGTLRVVDLTSSEPTVTATVTLPGAVGQLLVDGDHALVIGSGGYGPVAPAMGVEGGMSSSSMPVSSARTTLTRIDLEGTPRIVGSIDVDADYVDARMVDGVVRVVTRSGPDQLGFVYPSGNGSASEEQALAANRAVVARSTIADWLPSLTVREANGGGDPQPAVDCAAVDHPEQFSGFDLVTVLGLDLRGGAVDPLPSAAVVAGAGTVYASTSTLYVTTQRWPDPGSDRPVPMTAPAGDVVAVPGAIGTAGSGSASASPGVAESSPVEPPTSIPRQTTTTTSPPPPPTTTTAPDTTVAPSTTVTPTTTNAPPVTEPTPDDSTLPDVEAAGPYTDVHAFAIGGRGPAEYLASGRVRGTVLDQFSLSEHDGRLRMATTVSPTWWGWSTTRDMRAPVSESYVTVLERNGEQLRRLGEVGGLGRNEQIYSTRFVGDQAYVVTFRRTDPLYVVDLRDPASPRVAGELKVNGYSSYLQLISAGRLLGVGQDGTDTGQVTGFAESLFDVSDPATPGRLAQLSVPGANSLAEQDHHALLWWDATKTLVVPLAEWNLRSGGTVAQGVLVTDVTDAGIVERGRLSHPLPAAGGPSTGPSCPPDARCAAPEIGYPVSPPTIERSLVVGESLLTVSSAGVMVNDLADLAQRSWTPFT